MTLIGKVFGYCFICFFGLLQKKGERNFFQDSYANPVLGP